MTVVAILVLMVAALAGWFGGQWAERRRRPAGPPPDFEAMMARHVAAHRALEVDWWKPNYPIDGWERND